MHKERAICVFLYIFSLTIYLLTTIPTIYWGDSAEFSTTSFFLDISHPPSYPLYNLLGKIFTYLPIGSTAFKTNFFSAYFSTFTVVLIFLIVLYLPLIWDKISKSIVGIFLSLVFAFSSTFWHHSIKAEVYTLYTFFFAFIIFTLLLFIKKNDIRYFYFAGLIFLTSLTNHLLTAFTLMPCLFLVLIYNHEALTNKRNLIILFLLAIMSFSIYLYLPLRSSNNLKINWANPQTFEGFKYTILLKEQGKLHQEIPSSDNTTKKNPYKIKKIIKEGYRVGLSITYIKIFIILLPLYFSFLLKSKRNYLLSNRAKVFLLLLPLVIYSSIILFHCLKIPTYLQKAFARELFPESGVGLFYAILTSTLIYLSLTNNGREISKKLVIIFAFLITLLTYFYFLKFSNLYQTKEISTFAHFKIFINQFTIYMFILGILGIAKLYFENLRTFLFLFFLFLFLGPLIILIIIPDNIPQIQERFSLPAYLIFSIFIGFGIKTIIDFLQKNLKLNYKYFYLVLFFSLIPLFSNFKEANKSKYHFTKYYVEDIFLTLPKNSIILAKSIDTVFPLWYITFVEKKRGDIKIVYIDALTQKWYVDNLRKTTNLVINDLEKKVKSEEERRTLYIENIIKNNIKRHPIYYGGSPLFIPGGIKEGTVISEGILFKIMEVPRDILTDEEIKRSIQLLKSYKFIKSLKGIDFFAKDILPIYAGGYFKLGYNCLLQKKINIGLKYLNKSIEMDKSFVPPYLILSKFYLENDNTENAEKILKNGIKYNPNNIELLFELAHIYFIKENMDRCIFYLNKIIKLQPEFIPAYFAKADVYLILNKKEGAKEVLQNILEIEPDNQTAKNILKQIGGD